MGFPELSIAGECFPLTVLTEDRVVVDNDVMPVPTKRTKRQAPGHTADLSHLASLPSVDSTRTRAPQYQATQSLILPIGRAADVYTSDIPPD